MTDVSVPGKHASSLEPEAGLADKTAEPKGVIGRNLKMQVYLGIAVLFIQVERQPGRRIVREVLQLHGYNRASQQFNVELLYDAMSTPKLDHNSNRKDTDHAIA
jgi:hypothetical protein